MKIAIAMVFGLAIVGCGSGPGDTPGPTDSSGAASSNKAAEDAISNVPPEFQERARQAREESMKRAGGPPPGQKK